MVKTLFKTTSLLVFLFLISCSSNDDHTINNVKKQILHSIEMSDDIENSSKIRTKYFYDSENRVSKITTDSLGGIVLEYSYENNLVKKMKLIMGDKFTDYTMYYSNENKIPSRIVAVGLYNYDITYNVVDSSIIWKNDKQQPCSIQVKDDDILEATINNTTIKYIYANTRKHFDNNVQSLQLILSMCYSREATNIYAFDYIGLQTSKQNVQRIEVTPEATILNFDITQDNNNYVTNKNLYFNNNFHKYKYNYK